MSNDKMEKIRGCITTLSSGKKGMEYLKLRKNLQEKFAKMFSRRGFHLLFFHFFICFVASQSFISDDALRSHGSVGRFLLQVTSACTVDFENRNYTILTSQCKGPRYTAESCCSAFKEFACPFVDQINDENTDCAATMFSYINLYGKYPPGLFANLCVEGKEGLACLENATAPDTSNKDQKSNDAADSNAPVITLVGVLLCSLLFQLLET